MKIGMDARVFRSAKSGGIGKYVRNLLKNISEMKEKHDIQLFIDSRYPDIYVPKLPGIRYLEFSAKGDAFFLWEQMRLPWEIAASGIDIFHSPGNTVPLIQPKPTVVTLHDTLLMESDEDETKRFLFYTRKFLPVALKRARRIITISENSKKDIIRHFNIDESRITVIYHGIEANFRKIDDEALLKTQLSKFKIDGKYIFALGSLGPRKNTRKVFEVYSLLRKKRRDLKLVIAGLRPDALQSFTELIETLNIADSVTLLGHISEDDLVSLYNKADLTYYISLYEGFGFPIIESMACGCPVIASNVSSMPELVADKALLVNPNDAYDILDKSEFLLEDDSFRRQIIKKGLAKSKEFSWRIAAEKTIDVYKQALE